jgi:hypothetical protein
VPFAGVGLIILAFLFFVRQVSVNGGANVSRIGFKGLLFAVIIYYFGINNLT